MISICFLGSLNFGLSEPASSVAGDAFTRFWWLPRRGKKCAGRTGTLPPRLERCQRELSIGRVSVSSSTSRSEDEVSPYSSSWTRGREKKRKKEET